MAFYAQGILFCTYIGTVQVHIALLKFYMQTALLSPGRNVLGQHEQILTQFEEINFFYYYVVKSAGVFCRTLDSGISDNPNSKYKLTILL